MQKELHPKGIQSDNELTWERTAFSKTSDAVKYIGNFVSSYKEKPSTVVVELTLKQPESERTLTTEIRLSGYKGVSTIKTSEFIVHVVDKEYERGFTTGFAKEMCIEANRILKKKCSSFFDVSLINELVASKGNLKKMKDQKSTGLVAVFSALDEKRIRLKPSQTLELRMDGDSLKASGETYSAQLEAIALLNKLEGEGLKPKKAVYEVLRTINTNGFLKACAEYGFGKVEHSIASSVLMQEHTFKGALSEFVHKWEKTEDPQRLSGQLKLELDRMGAGICQLAIQRTIFKYDRSISESEERIQSDEKYVKTITNELMRQDYQRRINEQKAEYSRERVMRSNFEKTLKLIEQMIGNEPNKS
ncbi:MAG: hypothetical protein Sv326_0140 [Candidatus Fermentimicrarchaeum limneticum]|uniref:Uncharacterized protein n=1 Tax=Fermentimicrarchaeum limneticum TaxID=2795018 RepID=A0A7D6BG81_FERL1|nr:MAG: hypothetical protein Sv326_0140 [Candidatus Fermentimicrarchaeum limneticum]